MAGLNETNKWETEIYRIEENDPVHGGEDGITNKPLKQLANRTKYLKAEVEKTLHRTRCFNRTKRACSTRLKH